MVRYAKKPEAQKKDAHRSPVMPIKKKLRDICMPKKHLTKKKKRSIERNKEAKECQMKL
jgi:hypothetical protein